MTYGKNIARWYLSFFQDRALFQSGNTWLHGGFFNTLSHLVIQVSPLGPYETRHLCNALIGLMGVVATYRLGSALGQRSTGCWRRCFSF